MMQDIALVSGVLTKYFVILIIASISIAVVVSFFEKLRNEPLTLLKVVVAALTPFVLALGIPYFVLYREFDLPFWLNIISGFGIYTVSHWFFEKNVDTRFKDEKRI